jgi:hypothetical protein
MEVDGIRNKRPQSAARTTRHPGEAGTSSRRADTLI